MSKKKSVPVKMEVGKLFGLTVDPVKRFEFTFYHLITAVVSEEGEIIKVIKSPQSWMLFEARHKLEAAVEESLIEIQKARPHEENI